MRREDGRTDGRALQWRGGRARAARLQINLPRRPSSLLIVASCSCPTPAWTCEARRPTGLRKSKYPNSWEWNSSDSRFRPISTPKCMPSFAMTFTTGLSGWKERERMGGAWCPPTRAWRSYCNVQECPWAQGAPSAQKTVARSAVSRSHSSRDLRSRILCEPCGGSQVKHPV